MFCFFLKEIASPICTICKYTTFFKLYCKSKFLIDNFKQTFLFVYFLNFYP